MLLISISLTGCGANKFQERLNEAFKTKTQAGLVDQALEATRDLPDEPVECKDPPWERSGVKVGDRQDVAVKKTDNALFRQNLRFRRCANWWDDYREILTEQGGDLTQ